MSTTINEPTVPTVLDSPRVAGLGLAADAIHSGKREWQSTDQRHRVHAGSIAGQRIPHI